MKEFLSPEFVPMFATIPAEHRATVVALLREAHRAGIAGSAQVIRETAAGISKAGGPLGDMVAKIIEGAAEGLEKGSKL